MSLYQDLINRITALTNRLNQIGENSKTNEELPSMAPINRDALIRGSVAGESEAFSLQDFIDEISNEFVMGNVPAKFRSVVIDFDAVGSTHGKVLNAVNALPNFVLQQGTLYYFYTNRIVLTSSSDGIVIDPLIDTPPVYAVVSEYFVLTQKVEPNVNGITSIGVGGTTVNQNGIRYFSTIDSRNLEPQEFDLGEIGVDTIESSVDGSGPYSTPNGATILFRATRSAVESIWLYLGAAEEVGLSKPATSATDYREFPSAENTDPPAEYQETLPVLTKTIAGKVPLSNHEGFEDKLGWEDDTFYKTDEEVLYGKYRKKINAPTQPTVRTSFVETAGTFEIGREYTIKTIGTTDFTLIGASANTIGVIFTATGIGVGTGDAYIQAIHVGGVNFIANTNMIMHFIKIHNNVQYSFENPTPFDISRVAYIDVENTFEEDNIFKKKVIVGNPAITHSEIISSVTEVYLNIVNSLGVSIFTLWISGGTYKGLHPTVTDIASLGNNTFKWKDGWFSGFLNLLGVKSVENDATKVFATDGSVVDLGGGNTIDSITAGEPTGSDRVVNVVSLTQAEYDAGVKIPTTKYVITDAPSSGLTESEVYEMRCNFNNAVAEQLPLVQTAYDNATTESLMMVPSGYKAGALVSQLPKTGIGDFTVVRNSIKTRVNESGVIEEIAIDKIAPDFIDGGDGVWNFQPQSTNLYLDSELNNVENQTVTATPYTVFLYGTGTITFSGAYVGTLVGTGANDKVEITFTPAAGGLISTDSGTVSKKQLENLGYSTSYIKTEGATVTRLGDAVTGAGDETTFNSEEGVIYVEKAALANDGTYKYISITDGTTTNAISVYYRDSTNQLSVFCRVGGTYVYNPTITLADSTAFNKIAFKWKENDFAVWIDGVEVSQQLSGASLASGTLTVLSFDGGIGTQKLYAKVKALKVLPFLTDTQLTELTTDGYVTTL